MTSIIHEIKNALQDFEFNQYLPLNITLMQTLQKNSAYAWQKDYPIAFIHSTARIKDKAVIQSFEKARLLDTEGFTPTILKSDDLDYIANNTPQYLQSVNIACLKNKTAQTVKFSAKRPNDYWKKIHDAGHIAAMFEFSAFQSASSPRKVEFALRELIRKRKEAHALKDVGFIWMAITPDKQDLQEVFSHYFQQKYFVLKKGSQVFHLGWADRLREVSMRTFVCQP